MFCQRCGAPTEIRSIDGRERPVCTGCGAVTWLDPKLAVTVVIVNDGAVLLGKRATHTREAGRWSFPAGFVDRGECVEDAAIREAREETGLEVTLGPLLALLSERREAVVLAVYPAESFTGTPTPGDDLDALRWFSLDALPELAFAHDLDIIARWRVWRHGV